MKNKKVTVFIFYNSSSLALDLLFVHNKQIIDSESSAHLSLCLLSFGEVALDCFGSQSVQSFKHKDKKSTGNKNKIGELDFTEVKNFVHQSVLSAD